MTDPDLLRNPVEILAEEFLERYRRGERPAMTEFIDRHPELSSEIREVFPALLAIEKAGPHPAALGSPRHNSSRADGFMPDRLGDFRIVGEIGRGGMGVVYEAIQESLGRRVALKVLPLGALADPAALKRFRREARSVAALHHFEHRTGLRHRRARRPPLLRDAVDPRANAGGRPGRGPPAPRLDRPIVALAFECRRTARRPRSPAVW